MNCVIVKTVRNSRKMFRTNVGTMEIDARQKYMKGAENQLTTMLLFVTLGHSMFNVFFFLF